jgi:hypothetical protein
MNLLYVNIINISSSGCIISYYLLVLSFSYYVNIIYSESIYGNIHIFINYILPLPEFLYYYYSELKPKTNFICKKEYIKNDNEIIL